MRRIARNDYFNVDAAVAKNPRKRKAKRIARNDYFNTDVTIAKNDYLDTSAFATNPSSIKLIPVGMWVAASGPSLQGQHQGILGPYTSKAAAIASAMRIFGFGQPIYAGKVVIGASGRKTAKIRPIRDPQSAFNPCHSKSRRSKRMAKNDYFNVDTTVAMNDYFNTDANIIKNPSKKRKAKRIAKNDYFNTDANIVKNPSTSGVNLDSMDVKDLKTLYRNFGKLHSPKFNKAAEALFPAKPRGYIQAAYNIKRMARLLIKAKTYRLRGYINNALEYERECDSIYSELPDFAKTW